MIRLSRRSSTIESKTDSRRSSQQASGPQSIQVLKYETDLLQDQVCLDMYELHSMLRLDRAIGGASDAGSNRAITREAQGTQGSK
jgi:hypothetical protein